MKRILKYCSGVVFLFLFFWGSPGYSQNIIQGNDAKQKIEAEARAETEKWTAELAMSAKQAALMEDRLVEYEIKIQEVLLSKMHEEAKAELLTDLKLAENKAMRDILTKPQYDRFLFLKRQNAQKRYRSIKTKDTLH